MFGIVTAKKDKSDSGKWCLHLVSDCSIEFYIISENLKLSVSEVFGLCLGPYYALLGFGHMDSLTINPLVNCLFMVWAVIFLCDCLHKNCYTFCLYTFSIQSKMQGELLDHKSTGRGCR